MMTPQQISAIITILKGQVIPTQVIDSYYAGIFRLHLN